MNIIVLVLLVLLAAGSASAEKLPSFFNPLEILYYAIDPDMSLEEALRKAARFNVVFEEEACSRDLLTASWQVEDPISEDKTILKIHLYLEIQNGKIICVIYDFPPSGSVAKPWENYSRCQAHNRCYGYS